MELRDKYRLEWENIVINLINQGWMKSKAQYEADDRLESRYGEVDEEDEPFTL